MIETETIAAEIESERAGICEYSGLLTREQAETQGKLESEEYRFSCEIRAVLVMPFEKRKPFLFDVEKSRGKAHADKLRSAVQAEWIRRKSL